MKKKLKRAEETAVVAGVMAGLAHYFDQDPTLFRLAGIFFLIISGVFPGLLLYVVAWIMMPKQSKDADYIID
ncbi:MAG: hypothetical protein RLZZ70_461 [Candidatus Parcubacteria bacterium]|jgi:phage shock protein PspC (stress-responsive transcriptional regulator)